MKKFENHSKIEVGLIVTNNPNAGVIDRSERFGVPCAVFSNEDFSDTSKLNALLRDEGVDWIVLAGWLRLIPTSLIEEYPNRIVNIHPALLPKFGGKGMYGKHVHKAVKAANESESGISIHYVNEKFDEGEIIAQFSTALKPEDSPEDIEHKVRELELKHYASAIEKLVL